jgi:hypothetical protein
MAEIRVPGRTSTPGPTASTTTSPPKCQARDFRLIPSPEGCVSGSQADGGAGIYWVVFRAAVRRLRRGRESAVPGVEHLDGPRHDARHAHLVGSKAGRWRTTWDN